MSQAIPSALEDKARGFVGRRWVLERVNDWLRNGQERFFLLTGGPGVGKSALAAWLAAPAPAPAAPADGDGDGDDPDPELLESLRFVRSAWAATHFCALRGRAGSVDPRRFTQLLAGQLADRYAEFAVASVSKVAPKYDIRLDVRENWGNVVGIQANTLFITGSNVVDVYAQAVIEPLRVLLEQRPDIRVPILVDGLDEALLPVPPTIVGLLAGQTDLPGNVRLLLTSRNERRVIDQLTERFDDVRRLDLSAREEARNNDADVAAYARRRIAQPPISAQLAAVDSPPMLVDALVEQSAGNFLYVRTLLDEVAAGKRQLADLSGIPAGLYGLYGSYLDRIMPAMESYGHAEVWLSHYQPLLGRLSVAQAAVSPETLARWLVWDPSEVIARLDELQQLVSFDPQGEGGYRLYHESMADFLAAERDDDDRPNRYYVSPAQQHAAIVAGYLGRADGEWSGDWTRCDRYGLRHLPRHLDAWVRAAGGAEEGGQRARRLYDLVLDAGFRAAQRALLGEVRATVAAFRIALDQALARAELDVAASLLDTLAAAHELELRGLAVEGLVKLCQQAPATGIAKIKLLLVAESAQAQNVALKAAYLIGPAARDVFHWIALRGPTSLRQAAVCALYLRWGPEPDNLATTLLDDLANQVRLGPLGRSRRILELMADLSITVYINHCDEQPVIEHTSALWHTVLKRRLHLNLLNRPFLSWLAVPVLARMFARRVLEGSFIEQDPARFFELPAPDRELFRRMIEHVDPARDAAGRGAELAALLASEVALFRGLAMIVIAVQSSARPERMEPVVRKLYDGLDARGRLWLLLAFMLLLRNTPAAWVPLLEDLTGGFVREQGGTGDTGSRDSGLPSGLDVMLLPLGLAYGKRGGRMPCFEGLIREGLARGDLELVGRCVEALGPVAFYYPQAVFRTLQDAGVRPADPGLEDSVVSALATVRILHQDAVDVFLQSNGARQLIPQVSAVSDLDLVRRYIAWIGYYNNVVNQALNCPRMRRGLLIPCFTILAESRSPTEFLQRWAPWPLRMIREADYQVARWTLPD